MFSEQCGRKSEKAQQPSEGLEVAAGGAPRCSVLQCGAAGSLSRLPLFVCHSAPAVAHTVPANNRAVFHQLRILSTLDLLNASSGSMCPRRLHQFHRADRPGPCVGGHTPGG